MTNQRFRLTVLRLAGALCALAIGLPAASPAQAVLIDITFTETANFAGPANPGMTWTGTFDVAGYSATPNAQFAITDFTLAMADEALAPIVIDNSNGIALHGPTLVNDAAGAPLAVLGDGSTTLGELPLSAIHAAFADPVSVNPGVPDIGFRLDLNTFAGQGWLLSKLVWDGFTLQPVALIRGGTVSLAVHEDTGIINPVPEPATLLLFGGAFVAWRTMRRRTN